MSGITKKLLMNKSVLFIIIAFIISFISIPKEETKAGLIKLEVLEIEPGNYFELSSDDNINVTKLDMPTFISNVDELAGKYDVIYIGRKNNKNGKTLGTHWNADSIYRDYSADLDSDLEADGSNIIFNPNNNSSYLNGDPNWLQYAQTVWYGTMGYYDNWADVKATKSGDFKIYSGNFNNYNKSSDYMTVKEYYSENDITNKRAKEIIKLIDSGQLVYIDKDIFEDELRNTKLRSNFNDYYNGQKLGENLKFVDSISSSIIEDDYTLMESEYKRPKVDLISSPDGDVEVGSNLSSGYGSISNRKMTFDFTVELPEGSTGSESYFANLYLDYNGDGLFKEDDCEKVISNYVVNLGSNTIEFTLDTVFIGYLEWKIEVCNSNDEDVKTNIYGEAVFKLISGEDAASIRVLQIKASKGNNLSLSSNSIFKDLIKKINDYNITVTTKTTAEFNGMDVDYVKDHYDMIIIGFGDNYGNFDENSFGSNAVNILKTFDEANKSIMLTHDTISLATAGKSKVNGHVYERSNYKLSQAFKDLIGQSRYTDPYVNNSDIPHDDFKSGYVTLGSTVYSSVKLYEGTKTRYIKEVNKGQITRYPFKLTTLSSQSSTDRPYSFSVSQTHIQWFQLNLESEELVPWYNMVHDSSEKHKLYFNEGDSRNFYYTYSIGNITYSGTGHSSDYTDNEMKLLVNTIIKAHRGANVPPIITNTVNNEVIDNKQEISLETIEKPFTFSSNIYHRFSKPGRDKLKVSVVTDDGIYLSTEDGTVLNKAELLYTEGGIDIPLQLSAEYLASRIGDTISINVDAVDRYGEAAERKTIKLVIGINEATIYHGVDKTEEDNDIVADYTVFKPESFAYISGLEVLKIIDDNELVKDFYTEVPFMAYIRCIVSDVKLKLNLDEKFAEDGINPRTLSEPKVYVVNNGELYELGEMEWSTDEKCYIYNLSKDRIKALDGSIESNVYCNIIIKYSGKTYRNSVLQEQINYNNIVTVKAERYSKAGIAKIKVGEIFKKVLF